MDLENLSTIQDFIAPRVRRDFKSEAPDDFCMEGDNGQVSDTIELKKRPGNDVVSDTRNVNCREVQTSEDENKITIRGRVRRTDSTTDVSVTSSQNLRYRLVGILSWRGQIRVVARPGSPPTEWNKSPNYNLDNLPLPIHRNCPVFLRVFDGDNDTIRCYKFEDSCTGNFCNAQNSNRFYVIYEECVLLLPRNSRSTVVGISLEDTVDTEGLPVGGQSLLELSLDVQTGDSDCVGVGSFSSANPTGCHLLVPDMTIKIFVYASTTVDGVSIGDRFKCAIETNPDPDDVLNVTVTEETFDSTVIDTVDAIGSGDWEKYKIEIEWKPMASVADDFRLCCFFFYRDGGARETSEAKCDITFASDGGTTSLFTILSWTGTSPSAVTKFVIDDFDEIVLTLSEKADATQSNNAAAITFLEGTSQRWELSVNNITNGGSSLTVSNTDNDVTISLDQSKIDDIPLDVVLSVSIENGFFERTVSTCKQYSEEFSLTSICFHFKDISPNASSLEFTFGTPSTLTFSFADLEYIVQKNDISDLIDVEDDAARELFIESGDISPASGTMVMGTIVNEFVMDLPSNFSITELKTVINVKLPANLFSITQCTDVDVFNSVFPPMDDSTFSVCYNKPVTVDSVNPSGNTLFTSFQDFLEINFIYQIEMGKNGKNAKINNGSADVVTQAAESANFTDGKFYLSFTTAEHDVEYSLIFDEEFASTITETCENERLYSEPDSGSLSFCFYERPSIDTSNITPISSSNILASSVQLSIGISGVQYGPELEAGSAPVIVYKGDDTTNPFQEIAFSGTPPLLTASSLDEVVVRINLVANDYYTVVIPPSFVQVTDCSTPYPNTDTHSFIFCSIDLVLVRFEHFNIASEDEVTRFELSFVNDIKIGFDDPYIVISSNIVKIFDDTQGNRYTIENNKVTIFLPEESNEDIATHEVEFPAGLFKYKRDDLCVIPTKEIRKSFPELAAQFQQIEAANTNVNNDVSMPSANEAPLEDIIIQRIMDSQTQLLNQEIVPQLPIELNEDSGIELPPLDTVTNVEQPQDDPTTNDEPPQVNQATIDRDIQARIGEQLQHHETILRSFPESNERIIPSRVEGQANSERKIFGEESQINQVFGREEQIIGPVFGD